MKVKVRFLGTSGYGITPTRNLPSLLINDCILVDCGEGMLKTLKGVNISISSIKAVFLTHLHADHVLGLISLLWDLALYGRADFTNPTNSLPIYVPEGMGSHIDQILLSTFSPFQRVNFSVEIHELPSLHSEPLILDINNRQYSVDWMQTTHVPICYAYKFDKKLGISGDTGPNDQFNAFFQKISCLIHESTFPDSQSDLAHRLNHCTPVDVANLAVDVSCQRAILNHLPDLSNQDENSFLKEAKKIFSDIVVAHDLDLFEI
ncbi:MAG: MBL fold metallo-hydrolase [Promethearchaeota archaeon]